MDIEVNVWGVLAAFVASMVVGFVWYAGPVFGNTWMKLVGLNEQKAKEGMSKAFASTTIAALVQAVLIAVGTPIVAYFYPEWSWLTAALFTGAFVGVMQTLAFVTHDAFEQRNLTLTLINSGNQLATTLAMGLAIGLLQP